MKADDSEAKVAPSTDRPSVVLVSVDVQTPLVFAPPDLEERSIAGLKATPESVVFTFEGRTVYWFERGDRAYTRITVQAADKSIENTKQDGDMLLRFVSALAYLYYVPIRVAYPPHATIRYDETKPENVVQWSHRRPAVRSAPESPAEVPASNDPTLQLALGLWRLAKNVARDDPFLGVVAFWRVVEICAGENARRWAHANAEAAEVDPKIAGSIDEYLNGALGRHVPGETSATLADPDRVDQVEPMSEIALQFERLATHALEGRGSI